MTYGKIKNIFNRNLPKVIFKNKSLDLCLGFLLYDGFLKIRVYISFVVIKCNKMVRLIIEDKIYCVKGEADEYNNSKDSYSIYTGSWKGQYQYDRFID